MHTVSLIRNGRRRFGGGVVLLLLLLPGVPAAEGGHEHHGHHPHAQAEAAGDTGLSLRQIMLDIGRDMQVLADALWREDWAAIVPPAERIANHPRVGARERERVQRALGDDFGAFVAADVRVHGLAAELAEAAGSRDAERVVRAKGALEAACVACHTSFRARLVQPGR